MGAQGQASEVVVAQPGGQTIVRSTPRGIIEIRDGEGHVIERIDPRAIARQATEEARAALADEPRGRFGRPTNDVPDGVRQLTIIVFSLLAVTILGVAFMRMLGKHAERRPVASTPDPELARRLASIEQAIETMAVEVERVSEAQRYAAKLLTERLPERAPEMPARAIAAGDQMR